MAVTSVASGTLTPAIGTFTVTIASPGVFSKTAHGLAAGDKVVFSTTGALPTGLTAGTTYYVISAGLTADAFEVSATDGGSAVNTSGAQSGTHSLWAEQFLHNTSAAGTYKLKLDVNALAAGDVVEVRIYEMVLTGGTPRVYLVERRAGAQPVDDLIAESVPVSTDLSESKAIRFSVAQRSGTARAMPWKVIGF